MSVTKWLVMVLLAVTMCFGLVIPNHPAYPKITGAESVNIIPKEAPSRHVRLQNGYQVGVTTYDYQANGNMGQRIAVDDTGQIHVNWMYCGGEYPGNPRFIRWDFRFPEGTWYGETDAAPSVSGYCQIDVMQADASYAKRTLNVWHYSGFSFTSIDQGSGWGSWPGDTGSPHVSDHIWPYVACASNNNIVMATGNSGSGQDFHHFYYTTDEGANWTHIADYDSCTCLSQFVRASHNPGSQKIVHVWTQSIALNFPGLMVYNTACDLFYQLSTDNGVTWGTPVNVTNFLPVGEMVNGDSTPVAYVDVCALFDNSDNLHIVYGSNLVYVQNDTLYYGDHAKIFHWDEVTDALHVVSSPSTHYSEPGGWWLDVSAGFREHTEAWRMPACGPQLVLDPSNSNLYCLWTGTADTTDYSASGWFNGEIYGARSTDNGVTWSDYVNLTNTYTAGAGPGDCADEDYMSAYPCVFNDTIWITYIYDLDAGFNLQEGTTWQDNPVMVWGISLHNDIEEHETATPAKLSLTVYPNPVSNRSSMSYALPRQSDVSIKLYSADGRLVKTVEQTYRDAGLYTTELRTTELANGTYFVVLDTNEGKESRSLVVVH